MARLNTLKYVTFYAFLAILLSCGGNKTPNFDVKKSATSIEKAANNTKKVAKSIEKEVPNEAEEIIEYQEMIIIESKKLARLDSVIKSLEEDKEKLNQQLEEEKSKRIGVIYKIFYGCIIIGIIGIIAAIILGAKGVIKFDIAITGGITALLLVGVSIFIIKFMNLILWGVGILILLSLIAGGYLIYRNSRGDKINDDLYNTFNDTDPEIIKSKQSPLTRLWVKKRQISGK